ncbi:MAG: DUF4399 domain-containing protein [Thioalkalivibrio sp.]|nr:DUF4399 domain-containing protein [Thioalkalivibrio sp.]
MWKGILPVVAALTLTPALAVAADRVAPPENAEVYFISPADGETIQGPVTVRMGLRGMGVAPAGVEVDKTGHHHLLINKTVDDVDLEASLPFTDTSRHFGGGQTEGSLDLPAGTHTLQLLFMDYRHVSFDPPVTSDVITITVE